MNLYELFLKPYETYTNFQIFLEATAAIFGLMSVYFSIKKVQNNTVGITFKEDKSLNPMAFDLVKAILINANVTTTTITTNESPMDFGGGGFSGGGADGSF